MLPISKQTVDHLLIAPWPEREKITQVRTGKPKPLEQERSAFFKDPRKDPVHVSFTGLDSDEHVTEVHGGEHRAVHQYAAKHYQHWKDTIPERAALFNVGSFGENLTTQLLHEENICIGDVFAIIRDGKVKAKLECTEPRMPCYKLNMRFAYRSMLWRVLKSGKSGWLFRVLKEGTIEPGDWMELVSRPHPQWSVRNVQKVIHGKQVKRELLEELNEVRKLSPYHMALVEKRLERAPRDYTLVEAEMVTPRVRRLTFSLVQGKMKVEDAEFRPFAFTNITFGDWERGNLWKRSYSVVDGDLNRFTLGVALEGNSRGGSKYLHEHLKVGDVIQMVPQTNPDDEEHEEACKKEEIGRNLVILGGIGVTAFLPAIREWTNKGTPFEIHYAVRTENEAAFLSEMAGDKTTVYAKSKGRRLNVKDLIPPKDSGTRLFVCGPAPMLVECEELTRELGYPEHMVHIESFGSVGTGGEAFDVEVVTEENDDPQTLNVPADKSLLHVLKDAGFDVMSSCESGSCGTCNVKLLSDNEHVVRNGKGLANADKRNAILSCVDRGKGKIKIEVQA